MAILKENGLTRLWSHVSSRLSKKMDKVANNDLDMNDYKVSNLAYPENKYDAVPRWYVDQNFKPAYDVVWEGVAVIGSNTQLTIDGLENYQVILVNRGTDGQFLLTRTDLNGKVYFSGSHDFLDIDSEMGILNSVVKKTMQLCLSTSNAGYSLDLQNSYLAFTYMSNDSYPVLELQLKSISQIIGLQKVIPKG